MNWNVMIFFRIFVKFCKCASMDSNNGLISTLVSKLAANSEGPIWSNVTLTP